MKPLARKFNGSVGPDVASRNTAIAVSKLVGERRQGAEVEDPLAQVRAAPNPRESQYVGQPAGVRGVITVLARGRTPAEVAEGLMGTLAGEPLVVECDLTGMTVEGSVTGEVFAPVGHYLRHWPGTIVLICAPDPVVHSRLTSMTCTDRLIVHSGWDDDALVAHRLLPQVERTTMTLPPQPTAPGVARDFAASALREWGLAGLTTAVCQVLCELLTHAVINGDTDVVVNLSRMDTRVRIAATSTASSAAKSRASSLSEVPEHALTGRPQRLVHKLARGWGIIHGPSANTTVWAVLDSAPELAGDEAQDAGHDRAEPRHRGPADPDVLTELQGPHGGRHRRENGLPSVPSTP